MAVSKPALERMAEAIRHRGPDDHGLWTDPNAGIGLVHRRLSILDLSPAGHQPMWSPSGRYVIVFNGEVYNHLDLRRQMEAEGTAPTWKGHSDTETILAGMEAWGLEKTLKAAVGMFALALWDSKEHKLSLARDPIGEKPLYYGWTGGCFVFCSELKALCAAKFHLEVDLNVLALFLRYNYIPAPYSIYQNIYKLLPGTSLTLGIGATRARPWVDLPPVFDSCNNGVTLRSFRKLPCNDKVELLSGKSQALIDDLEKTLRVAISSQIVADVPVGAFLSGGVDSSLIAAIMQQQSNCPVKTFTIGFHEMDYDEAKFAKGVATYLGTDHSELYVSSREAIAVIPQLPTLYDEPFADSSQIPTYLVSQLARREVTVALSGDAGDELFAGYNRYAWAQSIWRAVGWIPEEYRDLFARGITSIPLESIDRLWAALAIFTPLSKKLTLSGDRVHKLAAICRERNEQAIYHALMSNWKLPGPLLPTTRELPTIMSEYQRWADSPSFVENMMHADMMAYLPDDILVKLDRAAMSVGLETRVPFLDRRVVEFVHRLPTEFKVRNQCRKWALRKILFKYVPEALIDRPKAGFAVPIASWLRTDLREWAEQLLSNQRLKDEGIFNTAIIREKWKEHLSKKRNWQQLIWPILMFQAWSESYNNIQ